VENPSRIYRQVDSQISVEEFNSGFKEVEGSRLISSVTVQQPYPHPENKFFINPPIIDGEDKSHETFLIVRSLKNKEGLQKG
jgi:hypothetical protein